MLFLFIFLFLLLLLLILIMLLIFLFIFIFIFLFIFVLLSLKVTFIAFYLFLLLLFPIPEHLIRILIDFKQLLQLLSRDLVQTIQIFPVYMIISLFKYAFWVKLFTILKYSLKFVLSSSYSLFRQQVSISVFLTSRHIQILNNSQFWEINLLSIRVLVELDIQFSDIRVQPF